MAHQPVDKTIEKRIDARLVVAREKKRRQEWAHNQCLERQIGRLAMAYNLHLLALEALEVVLKLVQRDHPQLQGGESVLEES